MPLLAPLSLLKLMLTIQQIPAIKLKIKPVHLMLRTTRKKMMAPPQNVCTLVVAAKPAANGKGKKMA